MGLTTGQSSQAQRSGGLGNFGQESSSCSQAADSDLKEGKISKLSFSKVYNTWSMNSANTIEIEIQFFFLLTS